MAAFGITEQRFPNTAPEIRNDAVGLSWSDIADLFSVGTSSGAMVSADSAARAIPVHACCTLIAGGIISMPLRIMRREFVDGMMTQIPADDHDFWWLFNEQPNSDCTSAQFWEEIVRNKLLRGRAFARIIRKEGGRGIGVREIVQIPNSKVRPIKQWDASLRRERIVSYDVTDGTRKYAVLPEDMLDFRGNVPTNNCVGSASDSSSVSSIIDSAREAIGITLTIEEYCGRFFSNGGTPRVVLKFPAGQKLDEPQKNALRDVWMQKYGGASNAALPLVLNNGGDISKLSFNAEEAQMLEARKFQVIEIARAFGVPPFMIGETEKTSAWGTGIEQMSQGFIRYTLGPHITGVEQELNRKLFSKSSTFVDFDEEALSRGDMKATGDWFRQAVGGSQGPGFITVNEVRRALKRPTIAGGDELYIPKGASNASVPQSTDGADSGQSQQA